MNIKRLSALGTAAVALFCNVAAAQSWRVEYDAALGTLPSAQGFTEFLEDPAPVDGLSEANYMIVSNVLIQGDTAAPNADPLNRQWYETTPPIFDIEREILVAEIQLRIVDSTITAPPTPGSSAGFALSVADRDRLMVTLFVGTTGAFLKGTTIASAFYAFDTTDAIHTYQIEIDRESASLVVDGTQVATLDRADYGATAFSGRNNLVWFGDTSNQQSSSSEVERVSLSSFTIPVAEARSYEVVTSYSATNSNAVRHLSATCPMGKSVLGGGAEVIDGDGSVALTKSAPAGTSWSAQAIEVVSTGASWQLRADVVCGEIPGYDNDSIATVEDNAASKVAVHQCDPGLELVTGGGRVTNPNLLQALQTSTMMGNEWEVAGHDFAASPSPADWGLGVSVICSDATGWEVVTEATTVDSTSPKSLTVLCPLETVPVGGGARTIGGTLQTGLRASYPQEFIGANPIGWTARAEEFVATAANWGLEVSVTCAPITDPNVTKAGLISRFKGDGNAADAKGPNEGTLQNGASFAAGVFDQAFSLDGASDQWVEIPGDDFYPEGSFTVAAWIQTTTLNPGTTTGIVNLNDFGGLNLDGVNYSVWAIQLTEEGYAQGLFRDHNQSISTVLTDDQSLADGQPHHIVFSRNIAAQREAKLYVDGVLVGTNTLSSYDNGPLFPGGAPEPLVIGIWRDTSASTVSRPFTGLIDDVLYYDWALAEEDIENLVRCGVPLGSGVVNVDAGLFLHRPDEFAVTTNLSAKLCVFLDAGNYTLTFLNPALDAAARLTAWAPGPTSNWATVYSLRGAIDTGTAHGSPLGIGATPQEAFDLTVPMQISLVVSADQRMYFGVLNETALENRGGVSLGIDYVPEPSGAGRVAELLVGKTPSGDLQLDWQPSCSTDDGDYAVFGGDLGLFTSHSKEVCSTGGVTSVVIPQSSGGRYYLVVPLDGTDEGSYGQDSNGVERLVGVVTCGTQNITPECP